jgi:hypothetical protein
MSAPTDAEVAGVAGDADQTRAVEPLEGTAERSAGEPLTYPSGV